MLKYDSYRTNARRQASSYHRITEKSRGFLSGVAGPDRLDIQTADIVEGRDKVSHS